MSKKKIIIIVGIFIVLIVGIILIKNENKKEIISGVEQSEETINKVATKKENQTFSIYNTDIETNNGETKLTATIKNKTANRTEEQKISIVLLDKNKKEVGKMQILVPSLESGVSTEVIAESLTVYENINDFIIE